MVADAKKIIAELDVKIFLAHAEALEKLGLWGIFEEQNRDLLTELRRRLGL